MTRPSCRLYRNITLECKFFFWTCRESSNDINKEDRDDDTIGYLVYGTSVGRVRHQEHKRSTGIRCMSFW